MTMPQEADALLALLSQATADEGVRRAIAEGKVKVAIGYENLDEDYAADSTNTRPYIRITPASEPASAAHDRRGAAGGSFLLLLFILLTAAGVGWFVTHLPA